MRLSTFSGYLLVLALAVTFAGAPAPAGANDLRAAVVAVGDIDYPEARALVNVEGVFEDLGPRNFTVLLDGQRATVLDVSLASEDAPLDVLFVIDSSVANDAEAFGAGAAEVRRTVQDLQPTDRVAIIVLGEVVWEVQDYTAERASVDASLILIAAGARQESERLSPSGTSRRAIVLLSGDESFGVASEAAEEEAAVVKASQRGIEFTTIVQGTSMELTFLAMLAEVLEGRGPAVADPQNPAQVYALIARLLRNQYSVRFDTSIVTEVREVETTITVQIGGRSATTSGAYTPTTGLEPVVRIDGFAEGDVLNVPRDILATVEGRTPVERYVFSIDGEVVHEVRASAAVLPYDPADYADGVHVLSVTAEGGGMSISGERSFRLSPDGDGLPLVAMAAGAIGLLVAAGVIAAVLPVLRRRLRARGPRLVPVDQRVTPWAVQLRTRSAPPPGLDDEPPPAPVEVVEKPLGKLIARSGSDMDSEYVVGAKPVSIGSGRSCAVRIDDPELAAEEARAWVRGEHLMVHRMTRLSIIAADGVSGGWTILEPGDTFEVGAHRYEFRMLEQTVPVSDDVGIPNILRDAPSTPEAAPAPGLEPQPRPQLQADAESPAAERPPDRPRLIDLMPIGDPPPEDEPDERAAG
jgi:hypothetical protein